MRLLRPFALCAVLLAGCDLRRFTADSTIDLFHAGAPQFNTLADVDFAEAAAPANLSTLEALYRIAPDANDLLFELTQGWSSYAYGFLEDHLERAQARDDEEDSNYWRARAVAGYLRAEDFGWQWLQVRQRVEGGPRTRLRAGMDPWRAYLRRFTSRDDAPALFWLGTAWASRINLSLDNGGALLDLPYAVALMERARDLDERYNNGAVHAFFGSVYGASPRETGGRPEEARRSFERALELSARRYLLHQVMYARTYAVAARDRALFERLLREVLDAGDVLPAERLSNQLARRRARRYLDQVDTLFPPPEPAAPTANP